MSSLGRVAGVVGVAGAEGQSSDRLSSHGWLIFSLFFCYDDADADADAATNDMRRPRRASQRPGRAPMVDEGQKQNKSGSDQHEGIDREEFRGIAICVIWRRRTVG